MRYGIVSDVHGNLEALTTALSHLRGLGVDRYAFLGDAVGYGADPEAVCCILRGLGGVAILGNHDAAVAGYMDTSAYYPAAREALAWCRAQLSAESLAWLQALPYTMREGDVAFCHGSPHLPEQFDYLFGVEAVEDLLAEGAQLAPVTCIGHSHLTLSFVIGAEGVIQQVVPRIVCDAAHRYIITVGSVGQPRDRDPRSCCAVFDTETRCFDYHRLHYDLQTTRQKILAAGLAPVFGERLLVGI